MIDNLEKTIHDTSAATRFCKPPASNNPEIYVLTHIWFHTYLVLIFSDLNGSQIYKTPYRDSPHHKLGKNMSFKNLNLFKPIEHTEDYHKRGANDLNFLYEIEDRK